MIRSKLNSSSRLSLVFVDLHSHPKELLLFFDVIEGRVWHRLGEFGSESQWLEHALISSAMAPFCSFKLSQRDVSENQNRALSLCGNFVLPFYYIKVISRPSS